VSNGQCGQWSIVYECLLVKTYSVSYGVSILFQNTLRARSFSHESQVLLRQHLGASIFVPRRATSLQLCCKPVANSLENCRNAELLGGRTLFQHKCLLRESFGRRFL
jgi:hypothetical protein